jgi:kynurenine formamidase
MTSHGHHRDTAGGQARGHDAIGALSRMNDITVRSALSLAASGRIFDLGLELNASIPHNPEFVRFAMSFTHTPEGTGAVSPFQYSVESVFGALHVGTHIDSLIHVQKDGHIFGGHAAATSRDDRGWRRHGIETVPPIVGRAMCLDIPALKGLDRLPDRYEITVADLQRAMERAELQMHEGDIVLVRTGKIRDFGNEPAFQAAEPGVGRTAALWLFENGMSVLGTDTTGTEPLPFKDPALTTHGAMLVESGVHLIENVNLEEVAKDGVREGLFIALPLKITGATGSWLRPILVI